MLFMEASPADAQSACPATVFLQARPEHGMSKRSYVDAVLAGLEAARKAGRNGAPLVRLLLSIDRRESAAAAMETVELAARLHGRGIVGIDLSGGAAGLPFLPWCMRRGAQRLPCTVLHLGCADLTVVRQATRLSDSGGLGSQRSSVPGSAASASRCTLLRHDDALPVQRNPQASIFGHESPPQMCEPLSA